MNFGNSGYVRWRRGLLDHYADGRLNSFDGTVFNILLAQADFRTGCWCGNAWKVEPFLPRDISRKRIQGRIQDCFTRLEEGGYVYRQSIQGQREYKLWIDKYEPSEERRLNAKASAACGEPVFYNPCEESGDDSGELSGEASGDCSGEDRVNGTQVAPNRSVAASKNSITQQLKNSKKIEGKKESLSLGEKDNSASGEVCKVEETKADEPYNILCKALTEALGNSPALRLIQRQIEEKAKAIFFRP